MQDGQRPLGVGIEQAFGRQAEAIETFRERNQGLYEASYRAQFISGIIQPSMNFIANLNYVAIAVIGGVRVASGQMSLGDVQAFIQYSRQFTMPITQIASQMNMLQSGMASAERVFEALEIKGAEDMTADHILTLRGTLTAIREGDVIARVGLVSELKKWSSATMYSSAPGLAYSRASTLAPTQLLAQGLW